MTNHAMVYGIAAESYSDLNALTGIIDCHLVVHGGGVTPSAQFVTDCNTAKRSPILNNGNDGGAGWNGSDSYNANLAAMGFHAVGGESEQAAEIDSIMNHLIFMDYGGEGTGGGTNDCVWCQTHSAPVHGFGAASYLETYDASTNFWGWNVLSQGVLSAKAHGVKEIGIMIGSWMMAAKFASPEEYLAHLIKSCSPQDIINLANAYEANGVTCAGIMVWSGYGNDMNSVYNKFASWFQQFQSIWPPETRTMKQRYGSTPPPPKPPIAPADLSFFIHALDPVAKKVTYIGTTYDAKGNHLANAKINIDRSAVRGVKDSSWQYMGSPVSDSTGYWNLTMPVVAGANYFWIVTMDGKKGYWTNDVVWV